MRRWVQCCKQWVWWIFAGYRTGPDASKALKRLTTVEQRVSKLEADMRFIQAQAEAFVLSVHGLTDRRARPRL